MKKSTIAIKGYLAVIPKIQNVYPPEENDAGWWDVGFKYTSQIFEFFSFRTHKQAQDVYQRIEKAIDDFYSNPKG